MSEPYEYEGGRFSYGYNCELGELCSFPAILVVGIIAFFLIGGIITGITEKGLSKGLSESPLFTLILFFGGLYGAIYVLAIMVSALDEILGRPYSFAPFLIFFGLLHFWARSGKEPKKQEHQPTIKEQKIAPKIEEKVTQGKVEKNKINYDIPPSWRTPKK